jgi:hypothetical protein
MVMPQDQNAGQNSNINHHHHFLLSLMGHRASTKRRHLVLSLAILFTSLQLFPFSNASLCTDLRHVCLGLPLLLFPCGFQSKTSLSKHGNEYVKMTTYSGLEHGLRNSHVLVDSKMPHLSRKRVFK